MIYFEYNLKENTYNKTHQHFSIIIIIISNRQIKSTLTKNCDLASSQNL